MMIMNEGGGSFHSLVYFFFFAAIVASISESSVKATITYPATTKLAAPAAERAA